MNEPDYYDSQDEEMENGEIAVTHALNSDAQIDELSRCVSKTFTQYNSIVKASFSRPFKNDV